MKFVSRTTSIVAGTIGVAVLLTACTGSQGSSEETVVFTHTGGIYSTLFATATYPALEEAGFNVLEDIPASDAKLRAMVESGNTTWDTFYTTRYFTLGECGELFEELDMSRLDLEDIDEAGMTPCSVPLTASYFTLVYNEDTYGDNPPTSWADFFNTTDFPGTRGIMNSPKDGGMEAALLAAGATQDELYPLDYDKAFAKLDEIRSDVMFIDTGAAQTEALASGEVDMMLAWQARAFAAQEAGANLAVAWNQPIAYYDALAIPKGAKNVDGAYALINALIGVDTQTALQETLPYSSINASVPPKSNPKLAEFAFNEDRVAGTLITRDENWWAENLIEATQRWTDWVNS